MGNIVYKVELYAVLGLAITYTISFIEKRLITWKEESAVQ